MRVDGEAGIDGALRGAMLALGNFDGFHLGHQAVVDRAVKLAGASGRPAIVATFDPHPVRFFRPDAPPFRLTTLEQRERLFTAAGAAAMLVFRFDAALARLSAEAFVAERLAGAIGADGVVTGVDFTFGAGRGGNAARLAELGAAHGLTVETVAPVALDGVPVSSSRIREALRAGDCPRARRLLTRPFAIEGLVRHGDKRGRALGYLTANVSLGKYLRPRYGIYAIRGRLPGGRLVEGVANIGVRPMFEPPRELLEAHFFDFDGDLYDQTIEVELHAHLRDELKFDSLGALKMQMDADCAAAREVLSRSAA